MAFTDILASFSEEDRAQASTLATKYPSLQRFAESGELLEKIRPRLKTLEPTYEATPENAITELEQWHAWKKKHVNPTTGMTLEEERVKQALVDANLKITELEERTNTEMTPDEIRAIVKESLTAEGVVTTPALEAKLTEVIDKKVNPAILSNINGLGNRFQDVYDKIEDARDKYRESFGATLRAKDVFEHMEKLAKARNVSVAAIDAEDAARDMMAPKFEEKRNADQAKAIEDAKKAGIEEGRRAAIQSSNGRGIPVDGGRGGAPVGLAQRRMIERNKPKEGEMPRVRLGSGATSAMYAQERREKLESASGE